MPTALFYDSKNNGQTKTRAFALGFGREERFKSMGQRSLIHTTTGITEGKQGIMSRFSLKMASGKVFVQIDVGRFDGKLSAMRHGITGIDRDIHDDLSDKPRVCHYSYQSWVQHADQVDILAYQPLEHFSHIDNHLIEMYHLGLHHLPTTEGQQLAGEQSSPLTCLADLLNIFDNRVVLTDTLQGDIAITKNNGQEVVEIMGYPSLIRRDRSDNGCQRQYRALFQFSLNLSGAFLV